MFPATRIALDGLVLRAFKKSDVDRIVIGCNDPELIAGCRCHIRYTLDLATAWCTGDAERLRTDGEGLHLAIAASDGRLLGSVSLKQTHWRHGVTEVGYWVMPDARGRGIATAACRALSTWALEHHRIFRVELTAAPGNIASQRVAQRAGFTFEGVARSGGIVHGGRTDLRIYSLIRDDLTFSATP